MNEAFDTELSVGPRAIEHYSRLSYTMWYALAEFVDNSTQSRLNYDRIVDEVLKQEGRPLTVDIFHDRPNKTMSIIDNSIGMNREKLISALQIGQPTPDSKGRSKYGMGMKTAACWIGNNWQIITCEWGSGIEWTATIDVDAIANKGQKVHIEPKGVSKDAHYTKIVITNLRRVIQKGTEDTIRSYLGSMYMFDLRPDVAGNTKLKLTYNTEDIPPPEDMEWDTDALGAPMQRDLPKTLIGGKEVSGWIGVLKTGGRKFGGFSIYQNERQIEGFPHAWKPRSIFGGVENEGANNLISQRLTGVLLLDPKFTVSHTKDAVLYQNDDEAELEKFLIKETKDYKDHAQRRRKGKTQAWSKEKIQDLVDSMRQEFTSSELKDALNTAQLPPLEAILSGNKQQVNTLSPDNIIATLDILPDLRVVVAVIETSEYDPYVTIAAAAETGVVHVIVNGLHPYYQALESGDSMEECIHQFIYDAVSEYRVGKLSGRVNPDSVRRIKDGLLRAHVQRSVNALADSQSIAEKNLDYEVDAEKQ